MDEGTGPREARAVGWEPAPNKAAVSKSAGQIVAKADQATEGAIVATFDLEENREMRANWGVFRDRRPDLYWPLMTLDGKTPLPIGGTRT